MMGEVIRVSGRAPDVGDLLREAMVSQKFADVALCCSGGQRFLAHRLVLSAASPYLQEVLLAHGKAAGYCEPITVILAEVEGPELAAILGFVYTGSATVPRSRLEAFTRAAETLHVQIPPLTIPSANRYHRLVSDRIHDGDDDDCKLDNVKIEETKIDSRYLRCEQYPSYDRWFNSSTWHFDDCLQRFQQSNWKLTEDDGLVRGSSINRSCNNNEDDDEERNVITRHSSQSKRNFVEETNSKMQLNQDQVFATAPGWFPNNIPMIADSLTDPLVIPSNRSNNNSTCHDDLNLRVSTARTFVPPAYRDACWPTDTFIGVDDSVSRISGKKTASMSIPCHRQQNDDEDDNREKMQRQRLRQDPEGETHRDNNDFEGSPASVSNNLLPSLPPPSLLHRSTGRSSVTFEKQDYDAGGPHGAVVGNTASPLSATVTSGIVLTTTITTINNNNSSSNKNNNNDTIPRGNDPLICGESCCRWRIPPRRHVANRVPASPWCQLARPAHHSPKIQPIVLRNREDSVDPMRHQWDDATSLRCTRTNPFPTTTTTFLDRSRETSNMGVLNLRGNIGNDVTGSTAISSPLYGFPVPNSTENTSRIETNSRFIDYVDHTGRNSNFYDPNYRRSSPVSFVSPTIVNNVPIDQYPSRLSSVEAPRISDNVVSIEETFEESSGGPRVRPADELTTIVNLDEPRGGVSQHAIQTDTNKQTVNDPPTCNRQTSPRVELSHPISRLCDSIRLSSEIDEQDQRLADKNTTTSAAITTTASITTTTATATTTMTTTATNTTTMTTETIKTCTQNDSCFPSKTIFPLSGAIVQSDSNNNNEAQDGIILEMSTNVAVSPGTIPEGGPGCGENTCSNDEQHRCDQCGKSFVTRASLKVHGRTHSGEKPFRCTDCGKEFSQLRNYKYHRSVHEGTREFAATCPECGKYFNDRGYLSSHMKIHRNRKEYGCTECGKSFNQRVAYNMHVRIHTGVKPHQCEQCGKAFSRKMLLKQHLRTHSGERPYQCQICHKAFADRSNMTLHTRLHSGLKPYQCTLCSKAFTKKHHLKTHLNYHTGTKPYSCPNCTLTFSQSSNMRTHYKKCSAAIGTGVNVINNNSSKSSNNPGSVRCNDDNVSTISSTAIAIGGIGDGTPSTTTGRTSALTPPSSDQESSILTPISDDRCKNNRGYRRSNTFCGSASNNT